MMLRWSLLLCLAATAIAQDIVPGRFIVELAGEPAIVHRDRARRRVEIRNEHQSLERILRTRRVTVRAHVDTVVNALIVDALDASSLASLPGVRRVEAVRRFQPLLTPQLDNHQVPAAWEVIGGIDKAGAGIKIGILDSGLNTDHPGFKPPEGMTAPEGFPQATPEANLQFTNGKVIVARSFDGGTITDTTGHGTGVAMAAAGVQQMSLRGAISGVAPRAWLGIYRVTNQVDRFYRSDDILLALDAAVKDGMDVLNLSFGSPGTTGAAGDTIFQSGTSRAMDAGILVVHAAGNTPGAQTVDDAASAPKGISVGANNSVAAGNTSVIPSEGRSLPAAESNNVTALEPISGPVVDTGTLDGNLLGCSAYNVSLVGWIPLIQRGGCFFWEKLANAATAGATTAIVYNSPTDGNPEALTFMSVDGGPTIPALFVGYSSGMRLKELIRTVEDFSVQLRFPFGQPNSLASFSSQGPSIGDLGIKPDLVATGTSFYTAAVVGQSSETCRGCDPSGYVVAQGTSFSAPLVAGAAAVIKGARPGLTSDDYRSLIINSASPMVLASGSTANVMAAGSGILNLRNAMASTIAAAPVSLSFGAGSGTVDRTKDFTLKNLGLEPAAWTLSVDSANDTKPALSTDTLTVAPGESTNVQLTLIAAGLSSGALQGFVKVQDTTTGAVARIPYWYAVTGGAPVSLSLLSDPDAASAGQRIDLIVRIHDASGLPLTGQTPVVTPVLGGGIVVAVARASTLSFPDSWRLILRLGQKGTNNFSIQIGDFVYTYAITAD